MKKTLLSLFLVCTIALTLTACSKEPTDKPDDKPPVTPPTSDETPDTPDAPDTMNELYGYMGKSDEDLVKAYGEGKKIMGEGDVVSGREYRMTVFGMETPIIVNYSKDGSVESIHLAPTDFDKDKWTKTLTDTYGDPSGEENAPQWIKDGMVFSFGDNDRIHLTSEK